MVNRLLSHALLAALCFVPAATALARDALQVELRLQPTRVVKHQQVLLQVEVTHPLWARPRWEPPTFDGAWTERLSSRGGPVESHKAGRSVRSTTFRRMLFPTRSGRVEIPASLVHYEDPNGQAHELSVPGTHLMVEELPPGPTSSSGDIVGQVSVSSDLSDTKLELGDSATLTVDVYGVANLWDMPPPDLSQQLPRSVEIFSDPPHLHVGEHGGRLTVRRTFRFELVPHKEGSLDLPGLVIPYFDPATSRYRKAHSEAQRLQVVARNALADTKPWEDEAPPPPRPRLPWLLILASGVLALALSAWALAHWSRRGPAAWVGPTPTPPHELFESARSAQSSQRFPHLLVQAVKARIHALHQLPTTSLSTSEIEARIDDPEALELLRALDRIRFGGAQEDRDELLGRVANYLKL